MDELDKTGINGPTGTFLDGLIDLTFVGPLLKAGFDVAAYTLDEFFRIREVHWANRGLDPEAPIYDELCREIGPPWGAGR